MLLNTVDKHLLTTANLRFLYDVIRYWSNTFYIHRINDRVISANNVSLEGVDYATAVQVLRDSGQTVNLVVKRRVVLPPTIPQPQTTSGMLVKFELKPNERPGV